MSKKEKQNLVENEKASDDEQNRNVEVDAATSDIVVHGTEFQNENLQNLAREGTQVNPSDVIIIEQLSNESIGEGSGETSQCKVIYEFPKDENKNSTVKETADSKVSFKHLTDRESENGSHLSESPAASSYKFAQISDPAKYCSISIIAETPKDKFNKINDTKSSNKENRDDARISKSSGETDRKRKKGSTSLMQNKKQKEVESSSSPIINSSCKSKETRQADISEHSSDEFADIEDNVKDSVSSDNSDSNTGIETEILGPLKKLDSPVEQKIRKNDDTKYTMVNSGASSSSTISTKNESADKTGDKSLFSITLKGDTTPIIKFSDDMKKKFELSMPTILEVRESESDEQIFQPMQSKSNPLKMKSSVAKRKDKCHVCNARLGLCAIKCRCGGYYCAKHRYDKEHNCTFDYKSMGAAEIQKNNPKIVAEKVRKL